MALKRRAVNYEELDIQKMAWLARHDGTDEADQFRIAVRQYLHRRKKSVYPIRGENPLEDTGTPPNQP